MTLKIYDLSDLGDHSTPDEVSVTSEAIAMVWTKHSTEPKRFEIHVLDSLASGFDGLYDDGVVRISKEMREGEGIHPRIVRLILIAAHEAAHAVQEARGDAPPQSKNDETYPHNRFEYEANQVVVDVLSSFLPKWNGHLMIEGRRYDRPSVQSFSRLAILD